MKNEISPFLGLRHLSRHAVRELRHGGPTRREFLKRGCCTAGALGLASQFGRFGMMNALAQGVSGYKALVCVFLFGGNDANNMVIPIGTDYANYATLRASLALAKGSVLPIQPASLSEAYGLHPNLPELQSMFNANSLAVLCNVGVLVQPTTRAAYLANTNPVPENLFSHADQQTQWQTAFADSFGASGWAGRIADLMGSANGSSPFPMVTSVAGSAIFCTGATSRPATVIPGTAFGFNNLAGNAQAVARSTEVQQLLAFNTGVALVQAADGIADNAFQDSAELNQALAGAAALQTVFPNTSLGNQLKQIAQIIQARSALGMSRQIFFASLGGFDTHSNQLATQVSLYGQLSPALQAFYNATTELGVANDVTTFTLSDFARTLVPATDGGTDHAWGSHHFIFGGAVKGGDFYGQFPTQALGGPNDATSQGRWIPTTSLDQYAATLAAWFGVPVASLPAIAPNLANFALQNVGFV